MIEIQDLHFKYSTGSLSTTVLRGVNLSLPVKSFTAIQGSSGSGKSTLLHLIGGLLPCPPGKILVQGTDLSQLSDLELALFRNRMIGFIFQQFHLMPRASVLENILLASQFPLEYDNSSQEMLERARYLADTVGLSQRLGHLPNQLSGGEQQRLVIARALLKNPSILLADEPTGNLDSLNAQNILRILKKLNDEGQTVLLITHDPKIAAQCNEHLEMIDGELRNSHPKIANPSKTNYSRPLAPPNLDSLKQYRRLFTLAIENLQRNRLRSGLTLLGVSVGIAAVFSMLSFGGFAKLNIMRGYQELGVNTVMIRGYPNWSQKATDVVSTRFESFNFERDLLPLKRIFPHVKKLTPIQHAWASGAHFAGESLKEELMIMGVNEDALTLTGRELKSGRFINLHHSEGRNGVCVIGSEIEERLFKQKSALSNILFVSQSDGRSFPCKIIGVFKPTTSNKDWRKPNREIFVPHTYFNSVTGYWNSMIHQFSVQFVESVDVETEARAIKKYFAKKYGAAGEFMVDSDTLLLSQMKRALGLFTLLLTTIALITLAVGGMGINNMMLVSVSERLKEIGLRKALGSSSRSIRLQFLLESLMLSMLAGALGLLIGFIAYQSVILLASKLVSKLKFEWILSPGSLLFSLCSMLVVGILSGLVPAKKAEQISVVEALRSE